MAASCPTDPQAQKTLEEREVSEGGGGKERGSEAEDNLSAADRG